MGLKKRSQKGTGAVQRVTDASDPKGERTKEANKLVKTHEIRNTISSGYPAISLNSTRVTICRKIQLTGLSKGEMANLSKTNWRMRKFVRAGTSNLAQTQVGR